jgi:hypothetical protein
LTNTAIADPDCRDTYIMPARQAMFDGTLSGLRQANTILEEGTQAPVCADDREFAFLHAFSKTAMLLIRDDDANIDSFLELAKTFELWLTGDYWAYPPDLQFQAVLNQHDAYQIPPDAPDANRIRAVLDTSIIPDLTLIINELNSISDSPQDPFRIFLTPDETSVFFGPDSPGLDYDLEIDYGEVLLLKGILTAIKAHLEGQTAYDIAIDANDMLIEKIYGQSINVNNDVLIPHPYLLDVLPTPNYPNVNGTAILAQAAQDFCAAIQYYIDAVNYITSEEDDQNDDFLFIDPNANEVSDTINDRLSSMRSSILNDTVGAYPLNTTKTYFVTDPCSATTWLLNLDFDMFLLPEETGTLVASGSAPSPWVVEGVNIDGNTIMVEMDYDVSGEWSQALLTGDISQDHNSISNITLEYWGYYTGSIYNMSGQLITTETDFKHLDLNPIFGSSPRYPQPLNPRDILPQFDNWNSPLPDTMDNGLGQDPTLGGILPDFNHNDWRTLFDLQPAGLVYLQEIQPWQKGPYGFVNVWRQIDLILQDPASDTDEDSNAVDNVDLDKLYMGYDDNYIYGQITYHDYDQDDQFSHTFCSITLSYSPDNEDSLGSIRFDFDIRPFDEEVYCSIYYLTDSGYGYLYWDYITSFYAQLGTAGISFRIPWDSLPNNLAGRFLSVDTDGYNDLTYESDSEDNKTHIRLGEVGSISGTIFYPGFIGGPIFVQAYTDPTEPDDSIVASTILASPGTYTLQGIGLGWQGYVRAFAPLFGFNLFDPDALTIQNSDPVFLWLEDLEDVDLVLNNPPLLKNGVWLTGELYDDDYEGNWFAFDAVQNAAYSLDLDRITSENASMTLFARDGDTEIIELFYWETQHIDWLCTASGRYYVKVAEDSYPPEGGTYQIRMTTTADCPLADIASPQWPDVKDCAVDFYDLAALCSHWLNDCPDQYVCGGADFAENGLVNLADFSALANDWLQIGTP